MPIAKYFKGKGQQVMDKMKDQYGQEAGKRVFYAKANKEGMKPEDEAAEGKQPASEETPMGERAMHGKSMPPKRMSIGQRIARGKK